MRLATVKPICLYLVIHVVYRFVFPKWNKTDHVCNYEKITPTPVNIAGVIFEHRPLKELPIVISHFATALPEHVKIHIFHGSENRGILSMLPRTSRFVYTDTGFHSTTRAEYNAYMKSHHFWKDDLKPYDYVLLFQTDTMLCHDRAVTKVLLESFLEFDYIGAPWAKSVWNKNSNEHPANKPEGFPCACLKDRSLPRLYTTVGNGGLSWRRRKAMVDVLDRFENSGPFNEDLYFACGVLAMPGLRLANESFASKFAIESMVSGTHSPFGVHKPWAYLTTEEMNQLQCPGAKDIVSTEKEML